MNEKNEIHLRRWQRRNSTIKVLIDCAERRRQIAEELTKLHQQLTLIKKLNQWTRYI